MFAGVLAQLLDGSFTDTAGRYVDDALDRAVVVAAAQQAQIAQRIADFQALEEALAAMDAIGDVGTQQCFFQCP